MGYVIFLAPSATLGTLLSPQRHFYHHQNNKKTNKKQRKMSVGGNSSAPSGPIVGTYEYVKPAEKNTQTLVLNGDGSVQFTEVGETVMEKWSSEGYGTWVINTSANGDVVQVILTELKKEMTFKIKTNVRGIEDGVSVQNNVGIPIFYKELAEAKRHGAHKWRRKN